MFIKNISAGIVLGLTLATGAQASVLEACKTDIEMYCSAVVPGDGRLAACLYAHGANVTDECYAETTEIDTMIEGFFDRMSDIGEACKADIEEKCSDVAPGGGNYISCLKQTDEGVSDSCQEQLSKLPTPNQ